MRGIGWVTVFSSGVALAMAGATSGCTTEQSCASRPSDPLCQDVDGGGGGVDTGPSDGGARDTGVDGGPDSGRDAGPLPDTGVDANVDAHVPCNGACTAPTAQCLVATDTCVACLSSGDCSGTSPVCDPSDHTCVGCAADGDCGGASPVCDEATDRTCVECVVEGDCASGTVGGGTHCDTSARTCEACLTTDQCGSAAAARCETSSHTCAACTGNPDCAHLSATPVCNAGSCVQCLSNADCDATHGCELGTHTCVAVTPMSASPCQPCLRDSQCHTGQLCVPMTYDDPTTPAADPVAVGTRCLWRQDATGAGAPNGSCFSNERPYVRASSLTSIDGVSTTVCTLAVSTCESQGAFRMTNCMTLDAAGDAMCGLPAVHDGVCRGVDMTTNRCTVFCGSDDDCPLGFPCDITVTPRVCHF